jgi:chromosome segregation ATPase
MNQDDEIRALREKNASLISSMKNELRTLIQKQQDDSDIIGLLRQKVASYSSELIVLQTLIREKGLTDVDKLEQELSKLQLQNEDLNKRIAALERDMLDAQRKAEALSEDLNKEMMHDTSGGAVPANLREQLDAAHKRIQTLLDWRKAAITELNSIRVDNDELTQLLKILDKKIKEVNRAGPKDDNYLATYEQTNTEVNMSLNDVIA